MTRQEANFKIIGALMAYAQEYPDTRFHQMLHNLYIEQTDYTKSDFRNGWIVMKDLFHEESEETYKRVLDAAESFGSQTHDASGSS